MGYTRSSPYTTAPLGVQPLRTPASSAIDCCAVQTIGTSAEDAVLPDGPLIAVDQNKVGDGIDEGNIDDENGEADDRDDEDDDDEIDVIPSSAPTSPRDHSRQYIV